MAIKIAAAKQAADVGGFETGDIILKDVRIFQADV